MEWADTVSALTRTLATKPRSYRIQGLLHWVWEYNITYTSLWLDLIVCQLSYSGRYSNHPNVYSSTLKWIQLREEELIKKLDGLSLKAHLYKPALNLPDVNGRVQTLTNIHHDLRPQQLQTQKTLKQSLLWCVLTKNIIHLIHNNYFFLFYRCFTPYSRIYHLNDGVHDYRRKLNSAWVKPTTIRLIQNTIVLLAW